MNNAVRHGGRTVAGLKLIGNQVTLTVRVYLVALPKHLSHGSGPGLWLDSELMMAAKGKRPAPAEGKAQSKARILVVDDHAVVRQGLVQLIDREPDLMVCGDAESAAGALKIIAAASPDLAVVDASLKDDSGLDLVKDIKIRFPKLAVLVLSMHDETFYAERFLRAGARGYIMKEEATEKVMTAIRRVLAGEVYLSENMSARILHKLINGPKAAAGSAIDVLSDRELEVFHLIGRGLSTRDIARKLHVSVKTIEAHRAHIKDKLNLKSATELLQQAIQWAQHDSQA